MKKWWMGCIMILLVFSASGCGAVETFETVADAYGDAAPAELRAVMLKLPEEAAAPTSDSEQGQLYLCENYEITLQTMEAGDLNRSIQTVSGYTQDVLTVVQTEQADVRRYEFVWTAAGEGGDQLCRGAVLDDGNYHYVLTAQADAQDAGELRQTWSEIFNSFGLR